MAEKCSCKKDEAVGPEAIFRSPLDVLAEKFKNLPISTDELIEQIKKLAFKVSEINAKQYCTDSDFFKSQDEFVMNDEVKGEIRKFVDEIYKRKKLESDTKILRHTDNLNRFDKWVANSKSVFYGEESLLDGESQQGKKEGKGRSLYRPRSSSIVGESKSYDRQWLIENLGTPLKMALKEIVAKKPYDPVSYLGFWLLHYKKCKENALFRLGLDEELSRVKRFMTQSLVEKHSSEEELEKEDMTDSNFRIFDSDQKFAG